MAKKAELLPYIGGILWGYSRESWNILLGTTKWEGMRDIR